MTTTIATLLFVLVMTTVVPILVVVLVWRAVRRMLKNAGLPSDALKGVNLRELLAQARAAQGQQLGGAVTVSASPASAAPTPAIVVTSSGQGPRIIAYLFSSIGGIALAIALVMGALQIEFLRDVVRAEGRVVRNVGRGHQSGYYPVVRFEPDGGEPVEFEAPIGNRPAQFSVGEVVGVVYPPGRPDQARIDNWVQLWFGPMLSGFFALVFGGLGVGFLIPVLRQRLRAGWARENGTLTQARFAGVETDRTTRVNGRSPYKVYADWRNPVDGRLYRFQSQKALWFDPTAQLTPRPDIPLRVDPQRPARYWLDLSHLQSS
jgi:hypothetical protein